MFFWPTIGGFPIMDKKHPTAPPPKSEIVNWINHLNFRITGSSQLKFDALENLEKPIYDFIKNFFMRHKIKKNYPNAPDQ